MGRTVRRVYTTSGAWICPAGVTQVTIEAIGGGGGGGGGRSGVPGANESGGGGCGGGASLPISASVTVTPGLSYAISVAAGGSGGAPGASGLSGGDTTFAAAFVCRGGAGGTNGGLISTPLSAEYAIGGGRSNWFRGVAALSDVANSRISVSPFAASGLNLVSTFCGLGGGMSCGTSTTVPAAANGGGFNDASGGSRGTSIATGGGGTYTAGSGGGASIGNGGNGGNGAVGTASNGSSAASGSGAGGGGGGAGGTAGGVGGAGGSGYCILTWVE